MKRSVALLTFLSVLLFPSCTHKDLDFSGVADLTVEFDWSQVSSANPSSMMLAAFSSGSQPVRKPLSGKNGGGIMLPAAEYGLIAYNDDTEGLLHRGVTWLDYELYTQQAELTRMSRMFTRSQSVPRGAGTENQEMVEEPEQVWTSATDSIEVTGSLGKKVRMVMEEATYTIRFTVKKVENLNFLNDVMASVSGMSGSWYPARHLCSEPLCIIPFYMHSDGHTLTGAVRTFGYRPTADGTKPEHVLVIYVELTDGSKYYYQFDVSDAINEAEPGEDGQTEITVELDELPLPKPFYNGSGLQPDIADWEEVKISINM